MNTARNYPHELAGVIDPRLYLRLQQLYQFVYSIQEFQATIPSEVRRSIDNRLQLLGALREPLIGNDSPDPQLAGLGQGSVSSLSAGTGIVLSPNPIVGTGTVNLSNTTVTPGSYTSTDLTVDQQGRITAASNGAGGSAFSSIIVIANHVVTDADDAVLVNNPGIGLIDVELHDPTTALEKPYYFKLLDSTGDGMRISCPSALVDGAGSVGSLIQYTAFTLLPNPTMNEWYIL